MRWLRNRFSTMQGILFLGPVCLWVVAWAIAETIDFTHNRPDALLVIQIVTLCLMVLLSLVAVCFRTTRANSLLALGLLLGGWIGGMALGNLRLGMNRGRLEQLYDEIATKGAPFPPTIDATSIGIPSAMPWHYQTRPDGSFAIVYLSEGSSWEALTYPERQWAESSPDGRLLHP